MDALAIIQALDYIKNEEVYKQRLSELQEEKKSLEDIKKICSNVEDSVLKVKQADEIKSKAQVEAIKAKEMADKYFEEKQLEIEKRLKDVAAKEQQLKEYDQVLKDQQAKVRAEGLSNKLVREQFIANQEEVQKHLHDSHELRNLYSKKLDELKRIVNA